MLATVLIHHNRSCDADIEAFGLAKLWDQEALNVKVAVVKTDAMLLVTHDEGAFFRKLCRV